jgi:hypothetical protein
VAARQCGPSLHVARHCMWPNPAQPCSLLTDGAPALLSAFVPSLVPELWSDTHVMPIMALDDRQLELTVTVAAIAVADGPLWSRCPTLTDGTDGRQPTQA